MVPYGPIWSRVSLYGPVLSRLVLNDPGWSRIVQYVALMTLKLPLCSFKSLKATYSLRYGNLCVHVCP